MDPLELLRDFCKNNKLDSLVQNGTRLDFGDLYSFEGTTSTRFRSRHGHCTLDAIYFCLMNKAAPYGTYIQNAKKENIGTVAYVDKKPLMDYLEGKIDGCQQIDTSMPNLPSNAGVKRSTADDHEIDDPVGKRKVQRIESVGGSEIIPRIESVGGNPDEWSIDDIYSQEKEKFNAVDSMRGETDFTYVVDFAKELLSEKESKKKRSMDVSRQPRTYLKPIILVPHGMTATVNMYNVKEFLERGHYIFPSEVYKKQQSKEPRRTIARTFERERPINYIVSEKLPDRNDEAVWKRVIGVVVTGRPHQFKEYPFKGCKEGNMNQLLHNHMQGFYFQYHDDNFRDSPASKWNVKVLTVHRYHRHGDHLLMQQFWRQIDQFLKDKKLDRVFRY